MIKPPDIASINPVARIVPVLSVDNIGAIAQELGDRATQFAKGQDYIGHVLSKAGGNAYHVKLDAEGFKGAVLKMELGAQAQLGQTLTLKFLHSEPNPTFLLAPPTIASTPITTAQISSAAHLIGQFLTAAENQGVSSYYQANAVVTQTPSNPQQFAQDLKSAVTKSGLFYEAHLSELVQHNQSLSSVRMEAQNQNNAPIAALVTQQLAILENQRISWQGEVWPGQKMDWDIQLEHRDVLDEHTHQTSAKAQSDNNEVISSKLKLLFPKLGDVEVLIHLSEGRLSVNLSAIQSHALDVFKHRQQDLAEALTKNGQQLDALRVIKQIKHDEFKL